MLKWEDFLASKLLEDTSKLDINDPAVKAIMNNPQIIAAFTKDPAKKKKAKGIIDAAKKANIDPSIAAKAHDVANKGGITDKMI